MKSMLRKHNRLSFLLSSFVLFLIVVLVMTENPILHDSSRTDYQEKSAKVNLKSGTNIGVTDAALSIPDYMWDVKIGDGANVDLKPFIPPSTVSNVLDSSSLRISVGEQNITYQLTLNWNNNISGNRIEITLLDKLGRPLAYWRDTLGQASVHVSGGIYKLTILPEGPLVSDYQFTASVVRTSKLPDFNVLDSTSEIPTLDILMSGAMFRSWDLQRASYAKAIKNPNDVVDTSNGKRVRAKMKTRGGERTVELWAAGWGDPAHFSVDAPSFSGRVISGSVLFGITRFKLYSIRVLCGLLDYTASSIMRDEGILVRDNVLVRLSINGNNLGLYYLEETPDSIGFFANNRIYDGEITHEGKVTTKLTPSAGLKALEPIGITTEFSQTFVTELNQDEFAKTLAFLSRFQATHAAQGNDINLYRHPYLDSPIPVVRDLNINPLATTRPGLFDFTEWWLGWRPLGRGGSFTAKIFPENTHLEFSSDQYSFFYGSPYPAVSQFLSTTNNREKFDKYLIFVNHDAFQQRFSARMNSAYQAVKPYLSHEKIPVLPGGGQPYRDFDSELSWIASQVDAVTSGKLIVQNSIPALLERSSLLINVFPATEENTGTQVVCLYNLSPFSAQISLPNYVKLADDSKPIQGTNSLHLAPSLLFPTVVPVSINDTGDMSSFKSITRGGAHLLLNLERLRFMGQSDQSNMLVPIADVQVPTDKLDEFLATLETKSVSMLGGFYPLAPQNNQLLNKLPIWGELWSDVEQNKNNPREFVPDIVMLPLNLTQVGNAHRLSMLISNFSPKSITLDLARMKWLQAENGLDVSYNISGIWTITENPKELPSPLVTLGATMTREDSSRLWLGSPMLWTGALGALLDGAEDEASPNCLLVDFELKQSGFRWIRSDANELAQSTSLQGASKVIVIHEPPEMFISASSPELLQNSTDTVDDFPNLSSNITLSVSDYLKPHSKGFLIDNNIDSFWHVATQRQSQVHWVIFDNGKPITVAKIAILPRQGHFTQLWNGEKALLQGSNDLFKQGWIDIATLSVDKEILKSVGWQWLSFPLQNNIAYRYYRLYIDDPSFYSIAEVRFEANELAKPADEFTLVELVKNGVLEIDSTQTIRFKEKNNPAISGIIIIPKGYVLEIEPGSNLRFMGNAGILSYSPIHAVGTAKQPITLSPAQGSETWKGIAVVNAAGTSEFSFVDMEKAAAGFVGSPQFTGGLTFMKSTVKIRDSRLVDFRSEDGLHLPYARFDIDGLLVTNSFGDAIDTDWGRGMINNLHVINSGGEGVDSCGSNIVITNSLIEGSSDKGVSVGENSVVTVSNCRLINGVTGIAVKDQSILNLNDTKISGNKWGVIQYIKKPFYIYPELRIVNCDVNNNENNIYSEKSSLATRQFD